MKGRRVAVAVASLAIACSGDVGERQVGSASDDGRGEAGGETCQRVATGKKLNYVLQRGAILELGGELVVLELMDDRWQRVSRQGKVEAKVWAGGEQGWVGAHPVSFERRGGEVVVELTGSRFVGLEEDLGGDVLWRMDLWKSEIEGIGEVQLLIREWTWTGSELVMLGSVVRRGEDLEEGRVMVLRAGGERVGVEVLLEMPGEEEVAEFSRMGQTTYATTVAGRAAVLLMRQEPQILVEEEPGGELKRLEAMPAGLEARPVIEHLDWNHPEDFPAVHEEVEGSRMPVGLFGWRGRLFVLHRAPEGEGTSWWLSRIDPGTDVVEATARLPTDANHLTVAVGEEEWAFLEKGRIRGYGVQSVESVLYIPGAMIENAEGGGSICRGEVQEERERVDSERGSVVAMAMEDR